MYSTVALVGVLLIVWGDVTQCVTPWFFSIHPRGEIYDYQNFAAVAILSARAHAANLRPHLIWVNAAPSNFTAWCTQEGVVVHFFNSPFSTHLGELGKDPSWVDIALGAFGRLSAPRIYRDWGGTSPIILYTDCDVIFAGHVTPPPLPEPVIVALGPQQKKGTMKNSGVLVIHVDRWLAAWEGFYAFGESVKWQGPTGFDQFLILSYFVHQHPELSVLLPDQWNWKPYWGQPAPTEGPAVIYHFHGPKPKRCLDDYLESPRKGAKTCPPPYLPLLHSAQDTSLYENLLAKFRSYYSQLCTRLSYDKFSTFPENNILPCKDFPAKQHANLLPFITNSSP